MINKQPFGHSGHESTVTIFGGFSLSNVTQDVADRTHDLVYSKSGSVTM